MKVLIVDDSAVMIALLGARLTELGYQVCAARDGASSVAAFVRERPDLVLMDLEMPVMDGLEATKQIRALEKEEAWAWTPILFLTASDTDVNLVAAIDAGADDFMSKTVSEDILRAKMRAMARIADLRNALRRAHEHLEDLANRDGLTGLANRRALDARSDRAWAHAVQTAGSFGLLMLDVDHFKNFNDIYGHLAGDEALRLIAQVLEAASESARAKTAVTSIFAARYGGEEFCIVLPAVDQATCVDAARAVLDALQARALGHTGNPPWGIVTLSIGMCWIEVARGHIKQVFRFADARLYAAKNAGRNRICSEDHAQSTSLREK